MNRVPAPLSIAALAFAIKLVQGVRLSSFLLILFSMAACGPLDRIKTRDSDAGKIEADVVVYGATPAGIAAAIAASREGVSVLLIEELNRVGGMYTAGGMCLTDSFYMDRRMLDGIYDEIHGRIDERYSKQGIEYRPDNYRDAFPRSEGRWYHEPSVAEAVFNDLLKEAGVTLILGQHLTIARMEEARILALDLSGGATVAGQQFIDASYTGDLMAAAGVSYTVGREGRDQYGESLAGKQFYGGEQRVFDVNPRDEKGNLLPFVNSDELGDPGTGDRKIMNYNYRVTLTNDPGNMVPIPKPDHYNPAEFELLRRYFARYPDDGLVKRYRVHNSKFDCNDSQSKGFAIGLPGGSWDYPEADYETRRAIEKRHKEFTLGYFHFILTDPSVPERIREDFKQFGLPKDEHVDSGHFPSLMYIREARRMLSDFVFTQHDIMEEPVVQDSIGVGLGPISHHNVQRIATKTGYYHEGSLHTPWDPHGKPYLIPFRAILPKPDECENLLVPVCLSASHVAFGSLRLEPTWITIGQSAGVASSLAVKSDTMVHDLSYSQLKERLVQQSQILEIVR